MKAGHIIRGDILNYIHLMGMGVCVCVCINDNQDPLLPRVNLVKGPRVIRKWKG